MIVRGIVKKHLGRGTTLGFPTANVEIKENVEDGVYLAMAEIGGQEYPSLVFSGKAETFGETKKMFEVYILDWEKDLYEQEIGVRLIKKIREVIKFNNSEELVAQMKKDTEMARDYFKS